MAKPTKFRITYTLAGGAYLTEYVQYVSRFQANRIASQRSQSPMEKVKIGETWIAPGDIRRFSVSSVGVSQPR